METRSRAQIKALTDSEADALAQQWTERVRTSRLAARSARRTVPSVWAYAGATVALLLAVELLAAVVLVIVL